MYLILKDWFYDSFFAKYRFLKSGKFSKSFKLLGQAVSTGIESALFVEIFEEKKIKKQTSNHRCLLPFKFRYEWAKKF